MKNHSSLKAACLALCYHNLFDFQGFKLINFKLIYFLN